MSVTKNGKPKVKLLGEDGNIFMIIGACRKAAKRAGWSPEQVEKLSKQFSDSKSYDEALQIAIANFDIE